MLLLAFIAKAGFNVARGQPIAQASGLWATLLRDGLVVVIVVLSFVGYWIWTWFDPENVLAYLVRRWVSK